MARIKLVWIAESKGRGTHYPVLGHSKGLGTHYKINSHNYLNSLYMTDLLQNLVTRVTTFSIFFADLASLIPGAPIGAKGDTENKK